MSIKGTKILGLRLALTLVALFGLSISTTGCIEDSDCGICDPDNLILESISGINYASEKVHIVNPECEGGNCPAAFNSGTYFIEDIGPCVETEEAQASPDPEEFCRISPLITAFGIEFVFNNLLDSTTIELVRRRPDNPQLLEVYDWKSDVLTIEGPITRFNGDYNRGAREAADTMSRLVNLSCAANQADFGADDYQDPATNPCNTFSGGVPAKMEQGVMHSYRGIWRAGGNSCSSPQEGPDTCCTYCEWLLATKVDRYGRAGNGAKRAPLPTATAENAETLTAIPNFTYFDKGREAPYEPAIACRTGESDGIAIDKYSTCRNFIVSVDRTDEEQRWEYAWCDPSAPVSRDCNIVVSDQWRLPLADAIRETHPDDRPPGFEKTDARCRSTTHCTEDHGLSGSECMGVTPSGETCLVDAYPEGGCAHPTDGAEGRGVCRPQWFVTCRANDDTTGADIAYCMDRRYGTAGAAACMRALPEVQTEGSPVGYLVGCEPDGTSCAGPQGCNCPDGDIDNCPVDGDGVTYCPAKLALCDWDENGRVTSAECCASALSGNVASGSGFACDPFYQDNVHPQPLYQRDENLPDPTRACICPSEGDLSSNRDDLDEAGCLEVAERSCFEDNGELRADRAGRYAVKFVSRPGGVVYDPAIKGFEWRPADTGGIPRADIETCAEDNTDRLIPPRNRHDGWRANDPFTPENFEDFDRAMCSGQSYTVKFNESDNPDNPAFVADKVGNTLDGKSEYTFETPQFHVVPGSGFPTDNLRIGACDDFAMRFSNKYDTSPENLEKLALYRASCTEDIVDGVLTRDCEFTSPNPACDRDINGDGVPDQPEGACCDVAPVAGGPGCVNTFLELETSGNPCTAPCLTVDVENQFIGEVQVEIDPTEFGQVLVEDQVYRMYVPSAADVDSAEDPAAYQEAFWDVCGMPLVREGATSYTYEFKIDEPKCKEDADRDGVPFSCDNADDNFNPDQADIDADGVGDIVDLCPVVPGDANNSADSDSDGVGNECDSCRQTLAQYNANAGMAAVPLYLQIRNIPFQDDQDGDGIGDVCDNCIWDANCESFGNEAPLVPHEVGDAIAYNQSDLCQQDGNQDMVGDTCAGTERPGAAGPVGFGDADDFDQDGVANLADLCPRQPVIERIECGGPDDCGENRSCTDGVCNHLDSDGDGVGDRCDTCAFAPNPNQTVDGGAQEDDEDGDFVGASCETAPACSERKDARPFAFHDIAAGGNCCVTQLVEANDDTTDLLLTATCRSSDILNAETCNRLEAPHPEDASRNIPVRTTANCPAEQDAAGEWICRQLPIRVEMAPGVLLPPPGCQEALDAAGTTAVANLLAPLTTLDYPTAANPLDALWQTQCFLPQVDQDFDGLGDQCDKCKFDFDPSDEPFIDVNGRLWPNDGAFCNGDYLIDNRCEIMMPDEVDTEDGGSSSGGMGSSGEAETGGGSEGG